MNRHSKTEKIYACFNSTSRFMRIPVSFQVMIILSLLLFSGNKIQAQSPDSIETENITFKSEGVTLAGTIYKPKNSYGGVVLVHGSGQEPRMKEFAALFAKSGITVLTYDKRGVGESGGVYAGPEVGTNNIDLANLTLLAQDASAAVSTLRKYNKNIPVGLAGCSQAGWIIPIAADKNPSVDFMVLFSCPVIPTLEQLRFQFYTNGRTDFWENHTEAEAREHIKNDPDRYQFTTTDPNIALNTLSIPGLWLFGGKDIQIPVGLCIENLNTLKANGKPFEYTLFSTLGHNTAFTDNTMPIAISIHWIKEKSLIINNKKLKK